MFSGSFKNKLRAFFLQEVTFPASPRFRDTGILCLLLLVIYLYYQDYPLDSIPANDLAGTIATFASFKRQWFSEGSIPIWLPNFFAGMVTLYSLSEYSLLFPFSMLLPAVTACKLLGLLAVVMGGIGIFRLLRAWQLDRAAAFIGGLVFAIHPLVMGVFRFSGHLAFTLALAILPFYLYEIHLICTRSPRGWPVLRATLMLGFIFSIHLSMAIVVTLMTVGICILQMNRTRPRAQWIRIWVTIGVLVCIAFALSAYVNLPLWIEGRSNLALVDQRGSEASSMVTYPVPSILFFFDRNGAILGGNESVRQAMGNTPLLSRYPYSSGGSYIGWSVILFCLAGGLLRRKQPGFNLFSLGLLWLFMAWMALGRTSVLSSYRWLLAKGAVNTAILTLLCALILAVWAFTTISGSRDWFSRRNLPKIALFLAVAGCVFLLPGFVGLSTLMPFLDNIRAPSQFLVPAFVLLSILAGAAVHEVRQHFGLFWRGVVTAAIILLLLLDFFPYRYGSLNEVSGFAWPRLQEMTTFLKKQEHPNRVFYARAYSPVMDYAVSALAGQNSFSHWLNWGAPRYMGMYRQKLYDAFVLWQETGNSERWRTLMSIANIHFVAIPRFEVALPEEPSLEKVFHNLIFDVYAFKGARGFWQLYPVNAAHSSNPRTWEDDLVLAFQQQRALVAAEHDSFASTTVEGASYDHTPGRIIKWSRPTSSRSWAEVECAEPGILMWSESFHPAWRVHLDGREAELLRVNHAFLGVRVPSGKHRVLFEFGPYPWRWLGAMISLLTLAALLIVFLIARLRNRIHGK